MKMFINIKLRTIQTKKGWLFFVELSHSLNFFITFKIFHVFNIINECLKEFRYCVRGPGCSKIVNFVVWGRISPAVYWWHQNQSSYIVCTTSCDVVQQNQSFPSTYSLTHSLTHSQSCVWRQAQCLKMKTYLEYQPSGAGGTRSPPATPHRLKNPKWPLGGSKMADGVWKGVSSYVFGFSRQLSLN